MDAGVPGQELVDPVGHRPQGGRRGGAVEVAVGAFDAVEAGDRFVRTDQRRHGFLPLHAVTIRSAGVRRYPAAQWGPGSPTRRRAREHDDVVRTPLVGRHGLNDVVRHPARLAARRHAQGGLQQGEALVEVAAASLDQPVGEHHQASPVQVERVVLVVAGMDAQRRPGRDRELDGLARLHLHRRRVPGRGERDCTGPDVEDADERGGQPPLDARQGDPVEPLQRLARNPLFQQEQAEGVAQPAHDPRRAEVVALHVAHHEGNEILADRDDVVPVAADLDANGRWPVAGGHVPSCDGGDGVGQQVLLQLVRDPPLPVEVAGLDDDGADLVGQLLGQSEVLLGEAATRPGGDEGDRAEDLFVA